MQRPRNLTTHECQASKAAVTNFFQSCIDWLNEKGQEPIGEEEKTVQIDESLMSKRKNN